MFPKVSNRVYLCYKIHNIFDFINKSCRKDKKYLMTNQVPTIRELYLFNFVAFDLGLNSEMSIIIFPYYMMA